MKKVPLAVWALVALLFKLLLFALLNVINIVSTDESEKDFLLSE
jgi:hypothetical protein